MAWFCNQICTGTALHQGWIQRGYNDTEAPCLQSTFQHQQLWTFNFPKQAFYSTPLPSLLCSVVLLLFLFFPFLLHLPLLLSPAAQGLGWGYTPKPFLRAPTGLSKEAGLVRNSSTGGWVPPPALSPSGVFFQFGSRN